MKTATNELLSEPYTDIDNVVHTNDTPEYRLAKYKTEFNQHLDKAFMTFYYILTELNVMMDSRAKNMMLVSYNANNNTGEGVWYPIFYDMDTQMGVNNTGKLVYRYDVKDTTPGIFNTCADYPRLANGDIDVDNTTVRYSVLWSNFRLCFAQGKDSDVALMYRRLRNGVLSYTFLMNNYNNNLANAWNETYINEDAWYKYIRAMHETEIVYQTDASGKTIYDELTGDPIPELDEQGNIKTKEKGYAKLLYAAQGTRSEHRRQWLRRRMALLDSKYGAENKRHRFAFRTNGLPTDGENAITNDLSYSL